MKEIKNIIFDFGGVVYDVRYENMAEELARRGVVDAEKFYGRDHQTREMDLFEMGLMPVGEFRDYVRRSTGMPFSDGDVDDVMNAMLIGLPDGRVELLRSLKGRYRCFLFSNTNAIHYDCFYRQMMEGYGYDVFEECFEACYFSHTLHLRKPARDGFAYILERHGLRAEETLFIDDNAPNLAGAREMGMHTYHLRGDLLDIFDGDGGLCVEVE